MLPLIAAGLGSAGLGAVASVVGSLIDKSSADKTNENNARLTQMQLDHSDLAANIAYERQRTLRDEANLYNDPSQQMARLKKAGLNPYLVYDNGGPTLQSASSSAPMATTPSAVANPNLYAGLGTAAANSFNTALQNAIAIVRLRNETKLADANISNIESRTTGQDLTNSYDSATISSRMSLAEADAMLRSAQVDKTKADEVLSKMQANLVEKQTTTETYKSRLTAYQMASQAVLNQYVGKEKAAQIGLIVAQTKLALQNGNLAEIQSGLARFQAETARISANAASRNADKMNWDQALVQIVRYILGDHDSIISSVIKGGKNLIK